MVIWINGPFGVGKTAVAKTLLSRLPGAFFLDPEIVGGALHAMRSKLFAASDFQHYPAWRKATIKSVSLASRKKPIVIVPMTVYRKPYFDEIMRGLRDREVEVRHFCLLASPEVIEERLLERGEAPGSWGFQHLAKSLQAFEGPEFERKIDTSSLEIGQVADLICAGIA